MKFIQTKLFKNICIVLLVFGALFLYTNLCIIVGILKERQSKICVAPNDYKLIETSINVSKELCLNQFNREQLENSGKVKKCQNSLSQCQKNLESYKKSLYKLKSEAASSSLVN